ncbi:MAG: ATP-binding protein [Patescibacteria group bacterium]
MTFKLGIHIGKALSYIVNLYPTLMTVVLELVQNSLDSNSKDIMIIIDYSRRDVKVRDDGNGISSDKFAEAIGRVCDSMKEKDKLGQFGIGMLSPLGKCKEFYITSIPRGSNTGYNKWFFNSDKILKSKGLPEIPHSELTKAVFSRSGQPMKDKDVFNWRTEVNISEFKNDRTVMSVTIPELQRLINSRFSEAMKSLDAKVTILIKQPDGHKQQVSFKADAFRGEKMKTIVYGVPGEQTSFETYISPKTASGRKGELLIGIQGDIFRIGMKDFAKTISQYASADSLTLLTSGTFEGTITSDFCTLHQNRKEFIDDDNLMNMVIHLEDWVKHHAIPVVASMKDGQRDEWLQAVGSVAISNLENRLKKEMPHLLGIVQRFKNGFVKAKPNEEAQDYKSKTPSSPIHYEKGKGQTSSTPGGGHTSGLKLTVAGPNGQKRRLVSGTATGLQFVYEELPGNDHHWEFDGNSGVLVFNMRSDVWEKMERSGERSLILYQEYVGIKALEMQLEPEISRPTVFEFLQRELRSASWFISSSSVLHPRKAQKDVGRKV